MNAFLYCKTGALAGSEYRIGKEATIGRQEQNDVTLPSDVVSGQHARIFFDDEDNCYVLEDLDSSNGTQLDGTEVVEPVPLRDLHIITFGRTLDFIFQAVDEEVAAASAVPGSETQYGVAPGPPSDLSDEDETDAERTRPGGVPDQNPDFSDEEDAGENTDRTRFGESVPGLPDLSDDPDPEADSASGDEESSSADVDRTRFGESAPELPDFSEEDEDEVDEDDAARTQYGQGPDALPDLSDEDAASAEEESESAEVDRTRFGDSAPELPDFSEEDEGEDDGTRMGDAPGTLPDLSDEESPSESAEPVAEEDERTSSGDAGGDDEGRTEVGTDAPGLPDFSEAESTSEEESEDASDEAPSPSEAPTQAAPDQAPASAESSPQYALQVIRDGEPQDTHPLPQGEVTIGRSAECDIQIDDPGISREHARLVVESGEVVVEDMGSKNFTFVDGYRLSDPTPLSLGSEIQFGLHVKAVLKRTSS